MRHLFTRRGWRFVCDGCSEALKTLEDLADEYFSSGRVRCEKCGKNVKLWEVARAFAREESGGHFALLGFGARQTGFLFDLKPGTSAELDFIAAGVPAAATLLSVIYTANGDGCLPLEWHGNEARRPVDPYRPTVFGLPTTTPPLQAPTPIATMVTWIGGEDAADPAIGFAQALHAISARKPLQAIVPAHLSFEIALGRAIRPILAAASSGDSLKEFERNGLTASASLNVLLPMLCKFSGIPPIPDEIRGGLNRLRSLRNDIVHAGGTEAKLCSPEDVGELVCAAQFGAAFVAWAAPKLNERISTAQIASPGVK